MFSKKWSRTLFVSTYLLLYASTSFFCKNMLPEAVNTCIYLFAIVMLVVVSPLHKIFRVDRNTFVSFISLLLLGVLSSLLAQDEAKLIVYPVIMWILALFYVQCVDYKEFRDAFINIMSFTAVLSVILWGMYKIIPQVFAIFPTIVNGAGTATYFLGFAIQTPRGFLRAEGFFWEPGAYQIFLNLAILMLIKKPQWMKEDKRKLLYLYTALILTFSTTGMIVGVLAFMIWMLKDYKANFNGQAKVIVITFAIVTATAVILPLLPDTVAGVSFGMNKIERFFQGPSQGSFDSSSVRYDSIYYPLQLFLSNPIIGSGHNGLKGLYNIMLHNMCTCTPINYFAMHGIVYGTIIMSALYKFTKYLSRYTLIRIMAFFVIFLTVFSENLVNYIILDIIIMYGLKAGSRYERCGEEHEEITGNK